MDENGWMAGFGFRPHALLLFLKVTAEITLNLQISITSLFCYADLLHKFGAHEAVFIYFLIPVTKHFILKVYEVKREPLSTV